MIVMDALIIFCNTCGHGMIFSAGTVFDAPFMCDRCKGETGKPYKIKLEMA